MDGYLLVPSRWFCCVWILEFVVVLHLRSPSVPNATGLTPRRPSMMCPSGPVRSGRRRIQPLLGGALFVPPSRQAVQEIPGIRHEASRRRRTKCRFEVGKGKANLDAALGTK